MRSRTRLSDFLRWLLFCDEAFKPRAAFGLAGGGDARVKSGPWAEGAGQGASRDGNSGNTQ